MPKIKLKWLKTKLQENKSLVESFFSLSLLNGVNALLPLITLPYILRVVGTANYGQYAYVYVLIQYLLLFNVYGFNYSASKQVTENQKNISRLNVIYNSVITCRLLLLVGGVIILSILSPILLETTEKKWMFFLGLGVVLGDSLNSVWLFQGMEKMRYLTMLNILSKSVFTILIFIFVKEPNDLPMILGINSLGYMLAGLASVIIAKSQFHISFFIPKLSDVKFQFREGAVIFGTTVGTSLYGNANVLILNFFVGESLLGIYAVAEKIIKGLQSLTLPIVQALFPYISKNFIGQSLEYKINKIKRIASVLFLAFLIPNIAIFLLSDWFVYLFAGKGFEESGSFLMIMSPIFTIGALNHLLGITGLINLGRQDLFFYAVVLAGGVSVLFLLFFVSILGVAAASIAMLLSEIILLVSCIVFIIRIKLKGNT
jgi:polysaccharide transporter, PST family